MKEITFKRNSKTGILEAYKDGKFICTVTTLGDEVNKEDNHEKT